MLTYYQNLKGRFISQEAVGETSAPHPPQYCMDPNPTSTSQFEHTRLYSERSIRLIELLPETPDGVPQCTLFSTTLDHILPFIALSYTWGHPWAQAEKDVESVNQNPYILCNGRPLVVTRNLYHFLKQAAPGKPQSWFSGENKLWIDAICINQRDLEERSAQVKLMSDIYKKSTTVMVWLGEDRNETTQYAVQLLNSITLTSEDTLKELKKLPINHPRTSEVLGEYGASPKHWHALKDLFSRTWFSRIWILQEVAFPEHVLVLCGGYYFTWESCIRGCNFFTYSVVNEMETLSEIPFKGWLTETMYFCRDLVRRSQPVQFLALLRDTRSFEATDPRDKIFAILGLSAITPEIPATQVIQMDYTHTPTEVYLETAWALIKHSDNLAFLIEKEDAKFRNITDLPSWVPDFSSTVRPRIYFQSTTFNADNGLKAALKPLPDRRLLGTAAYRLGTIDGATHLGSDEPFISYFPKIMALLDSLAPGYRTGEDRLHVLWRTLIQNGCDWASPAAEEVARDFRNWILSNIIVAAMEARTSGASMDEINNLITRLQTYSATDPTGLTPSRPAIERVLTQRQTGQPFEYAASATKFGLEVVFYETMQLFKTGDGLLGLGPPSLRVGDEVWIVPGVCVPMVLRGGGKEGRYEVVGPAYAHGVMGGEALEGGGLEREGIVLE